MDILNADAKVFKLVGPVLLKQDVEEAKANVDKRLEFIGNEAEKVNTKLQRKETEAETIRQKIMELQSEMQQAAAKAANEVVAK